MTDQLTTERLREIAGDPILLHYAKSDERLAMAAELLAKREECEALQRERDAYRKANQENDERFMLERDAARALLELVAGNLANFVAKREDAPASAYAHLNEAMESLVAYQPRDGYSEAAKALRLNLWREGPMRTLQEERDAARAEAEKLRDQRDRLMLAVRGAGSSSTMARIANEIEESDDDCPIPCETCNATGKIDQTLGGYAWSPVTKCPDCDGDGEWTPTMKPSEAEKLRRIIALAAELAAVKRQRDELVRIAKDANAYLIDGGHADESDEIMAAIEAASQPAQQPKPEGGAS